MPTTAKTSGNRPANGATTGGTASDVYFDLVRAFPLRPIHSNNELDRALAVLLGLSAAKPHGRMDPGERDYLEALALLIQQFEQMRRDTVLPKASPLDRLKFLMDERGMDAVDLGRVLGNRPAASRILDGKRKLTTASIRKLAGHFAVSPALFIE